MVLNRKRPTPDVASQPLPAQPEERATFVQVLAMRYWAKHLGQLAEDALKKEAPRLADRAIKDVERRTSPFTAAERDLLRSGLTLNMVTYLAECAKAALAGADEVAKRSPTLCAAREETASG